MSHISVYLCSGLIILWWERIRNDMTQLSCNPDVEEPLAAEEVSSLLSTSFADIRSVVSVNSIHAEIVMFMIVF